MTSDRLAVAAGGLELTKSTVAKSLLKLASRLPIRFRRSALRVGFSVSYAVGGIVQDRYVVRALSSVLHLPRRDAARVARMTTFHDLMFALEWLALKNRTKRGLLADARMVHIADNDVFQWAAEQKSVILATLHMASYATSLARLLHAYFQDRQVIIVRSKTVTEDESDALKKLASIGIQLEHLFIDSPESFLDLARSVKAGAVLISLIDLPHAYGRSCEVELLWNPAQIAVGIIDFSHLCRAPIVLFKTISGILEDEVVAGPVLQLSSGDVESRQDAADKIACFVTSSVVANPEQWHMWDRLSEYAVPACPA